MITRDKTRDETNCIDTAQEKKKRKNCAINALLFGDVINI